MAPEIFISGMACLSGYGLQAEDLVAGLGRGTALTEVRPLGSGAAVACGQIPEFKEALGCYAKPLIRRKMSRLSKLAVTAAGNALHDSGLLDLDNRECGVILGTAFGSTAQSELFFSDLLSKGALKANPGYFPETVPNAPAGQVSIVFGLQGPNTTVCQQSLSSEYALSLAFDLLESGMARRLVVVGVEEMSPSLLSGLQACGQLQKWSTTCAEQVSLGRRIRVGEASVALVLESKESLRDRQGQALARLHSVTTAGAACWPAVYHEVGPAVATMLAGFTDSQRTKIDAVIAGTSCHRQADGSHLQALATMLDPGLAAVLPEYGTGHVMGAGLLRTALATALVAGSQLPCRALSDRLPDQLPYADLYSGLTSPSDYVLVTTVSPGGGAAGVLVGRA